MFKHMCIKKMFLFKLYILEYKHIFKKILLQKISLFLVNSSHCSRISLILIGILIFDRSSHFVQINLFFVIILNM